MVKEWITHAGIAALVVIILKMAFDLSAAQIITAFVLGVIGAKIGHTRARRHP